MNAVNQTNQLYSLGETFFEAAADEIIKTKLEESKIFKIWPSVVGPAISENAVPEKIKNGTLYIKTKSPAWAQELKVLDSHIKKQINEHAGSLLVREVRFTHGPVNTRDIIEDESDEGAPEIGPIKLSQSDIQYIEELVANIEVAELQERMLRLLIKNKKLEIWRKQHGVIQE